ncbi:MAG: hypothetical protein M1838_005274 [Thelocarpon superellum]|nr:MAG: hypothetical protein M1838_005274 [Thelocarpon superellum]
MLPFKFTGGFGLSTKSIGFIISFQGAYSMAAQLFLFPLVARRFGSLRVFRFVVMLYPVLYLAVPYVVLLPKDLQMVGIYACLVLKVTAAVLAYPSNAILLTNSAPSMLVLGAINGIAASTASLSRAFGPTISGLIHSAGLRLGYSGLAWWASALVSLLGAIESAWMEDVSGRLDPAEDEPAPDVDGDAEADVTDDLEAEGETAWVAIPPSKDTSAPSRTEICLGSPET